MQNAKCKVKRQPANQAQRAKMNRLVELMPKHTTNQAQVCEEELHVLTAQNDGKCKMQNDSKCKMQSAKRYADAFYPYHTILSFRPCVKNKNNL